VTQPHLRVSADNNPGGCFVLTFWLVLLITAVPLRGVWSVATILFMVALAFFFSWMRWWDAILSFFGLMNVHINASGYLILSGGLFLMWFLVTFVFDRLVYVTFIPGQFRILMEIGEGETAYDLAGISVHKRRGDFFRHWLLGLGAGDLVIKTGGANPQIYEFSNVLFLSRKVAVIEQMLQEREVIQGQLGG
jgi:hypothetical protein